MVNFPERLGAGDAVEPVGAHEPEVDSGRVENNVEAINKALAGVRDKVDGRAARDWEMSCPGVDVEDLEAGDALVLYTSKDKDSRVDGTHNVLVHCGIQAVRVEEIEEENRQVVAVVTEASAPVGYWDERTQSLLPPEQTFTKGNRVRLGEGHLKYLYRGDPDKDKQDYVDKTWRASLEAAGLVSSD
jgi:hypothetical protein